MIKPAGLLIPDDFALTQIGTTSTGDSTPTVTRKSLHNITYDEAVSLSSATLPIYSVTPIPLSASIRNIGGAAEQPRATFDGTNLSITAVGQVEVNFVFGLPGNRNYNRVRVLNPAVVTQSYVNRTLVSYDSSSLSYHISEQTNALKSRDPTIRRRLYSTFDQSTLSFGRNASCFLAGVNGLEAYPVSNNSGAFRMNGIAISRRHILSVYHIGSQLGQILYFLRSDGSVITRTVVDYMRINHVTDQTVAVLDSLLPADFQFAKILVDGYNYLPEYHTINYVGDSDISVPSLRLLPVIMFNQDHYPAINYMSSIGTGSTATVVTLPNSMNEDVPTEWQQKVRGGDSGSPCCVIVNNYLAVLTIWSTIVGGNATGQISSDLQSAMETLCSRNSFDTVSFTAADLSAFDDYS